MQQIYKPYEGLFITIEGGDGCGKTTLATRLGDYLEKRGYQVVRTREPGGSALSEHIREILLHPKADYNIGGLAELLLFLAARVQHVEEKILPALHAGKVVICERFNDSTIAYQGGARYLGLHHVEQLVNLTCDLVPNCTLFLDIDPATGLKRIKKETDRLENEQVQFHKDVRQAFLHLADEHPERIVVLDGSLPPDEVYQSAIQSLEPFLMLKPSHTKHER